MRERFGEAFGSWELRQGGAASDHCTPGQARRASQFMSRMHMQKVCNRFDDLSHCVHIDCGMT
jgi:hypothetical protein